VPPLLMLLALAALLVATARPMAKITLPLSQRTIILAMDVSGSMRAEDVEPNRLVASQEAAKTFVQQLPRDARIGVVAFAGTAAVVQAPTTSREDIVAAIDRFQLQRATATGSGDHPVAGHAVPRARHRDLAHHRPAQVPGQGDRRRQAQGRVHAGEPGSYGSAAIIMLTDGQRTTGPDPLDAAKMAAERGVRVYTVGVGTKEGEIIGFEGWSMRVRLDEDTLKKVSTMTLGEYFYAGTADDLKKVYESLSSRMVVERKEVEVSALFAALGALLAVLSAGLSVFWFGRIA
jgi:Ca-activated chloride channel homolog